jgi:hypothetical protein
MNLSKHRMVYAFIRSSSARGRARLLMCVVLALVIPVVIWPTVILLGQTAEASMSCPCVHGTDSTVVEKLMSSTGPKESALTDDVAASTQRGHLAGEVRSCL